MVHHGMCFTGCSLPDGKTLGRFAPSLFPASAGGQRFRRCIWFVHEKKSKETALFPYSFLVQRRGRRLRAERGSASDFSELARIKCLRKGSALDPRGLRPRFFRACEEKLSRQGYRALDRGMRFAFELQLCAAPPLRYLVSCTPLLAAELGAGARPCRRPRSGQGHAPAAVRARTVHCQKIPLRSSKSAAGMGL
ncbi:hypothetical protein SAMN02910317_00977 [Ruminococcaceae bacterium FB2012]|nr:hypothetical protein SAMN02910317_00977 [Ruminococcaceae bacterium FB2012]